MSPGVLVALCDDNDDGTADAAVVLDICVRASQRVDSFIAINYPGLPLPIAQTPVPGMVREAALEWAQVFCYQRHPEYVRQFGEMARAMPSLKSAEQLCDNLVKALERIPDLVAAPDPANVIATFATGPDDQHPDGIGSGTFAEGWGQFG